MMIAYTLRRKDYTNSICIARISLRRPAGFTLKRITTGSRSEKMRAKQKEDEKESNC